MRDALRVDARWIGIASKAHLDGTAIGKVKIDPLMYGAAYVLRF